MKPVTDFFSRITPHVVSCPDPVIQQALVDAAIEFCEKTLIIRYTPDSFPTVAGTATYDFDIPTYQEYSRVVYMTIDGKPLSPLVRSDLPTTPTSNSKPTHYYVTQNESELLLNLYPTPDDVYTIDMSIALRPTRDATFLEDDLHRYWLEALAHSTMSRLMAIPGQPYSNPDGAVYHGRKAAMSCRSARIEGNMGRVVGSMTVTPKPLVR